MVLGTPTLRPRRGPVMEAAWSVLTLVLVVGLFFVSFIVGICIFVPFWEWFWDRWFEWKERS